MRKVSLHEKDVLLNRDRLIEVLDSQGMNHKDLYHKITEKYGLDISYKGFMNLITNRSSWKLLYAYTIIEVLSINLRDIFEMVDINIDKKIKEKEKWKSKYQNKQKV